MVVAILGYAAGCGGDRPTEPPRPEPTTPSSVVATSATTQTAQVATAVGARPAVRVTTAAAAPVANITVTFAIAEGAGSLTGATQQTDANGVATVGGWTLGTTAGANAVTATVAGLLAVTFAATGTAGPPASVTKQAGDNQSTTVGQAVVTRPAVIVKDAHSNAIAGATVTFTVASGGGAVAGESATTDATGVATVGGWTLGTTAGANALTATVTGVDPITFTATGTPGAPASLTKHVGDDQTATVDHDVPVSPAVMVKDAHGNPVSGVTVTFSSVSPGATLAGATQVTDAAGTATIGRWKLGTAAVHYSLLASVPGLPSVSFTAKATAGAPATVTKQAGDEQTTTVGLPVFVRPAVRVTDAHGNGVAGVQVTFSTTAGSGSVFGATQITDAGGLATAGGWTVGTTTGAHTLTATATGLPPVSFTAFAKPSGVSSIAKHAGDGQSATVNEPVAVRPAVLITDPFGNVVPEAEVRFTITAGNGSLSGATVQADQAGIARLGEWRLGTKVGVNTVTASAGTATPVAFTATGTSGPAASVMKQGGDGQSATVDEAVAVRPSVLVTDAYGNPLSGATVTFFVASGGGSATDAIQVTGAAGIATVGAWQLGKVAGSNTLNASVDGVGVAVFSATGRPGPTTSVIVSPDRASIEVDEQMTFTATLRDAHGNPTTEGSLAWSSSDESKATVSPEGRVTGVAIGSATITATSEGVSGTAAVTVRAPAVASVELDPSAFSVPVSVGRGVTATVRDARGKKLTGHAVSWSTSDASIASIGQVFRDDAAGIYHAVIFGRSTGTAIITATSEAKSGQATVTVTPSPELFVDSVLASPNPVRVGSAGAEVTLTAYVRSAVGVDRVVIRYRPPSGASGEGACGAALTSGTREDGAWSCKGTIIAGVLAGTWSVSVYVENAQRAMETGYGKGTFVVIVE